MEAFQVEIQDEDLADLRGRLGQTRWPSGATALADDDDVEFRGALADLSHRRIICPDRA
jgi:hypothetical protein